MESCFSSKKFLILSIECSTYLGINQDNPGPSTTSSAQEASSIKSTKSVKTFTEYKAAKGKQWFSKVKGGKAKSRKTSTADQEVLIYIGLLEWNEKERVLKPKRGKKVALRILNSAKSSLVRQKAEEKWKAFYSNFYDENQTYLLLYEDGQKVLFLPGTSELFTLKRYQEELGKDYNRIYLYLCTNEDYNNTVMSGDDSEDDSKSRLPKCSKLVDDSEDDSMSRLPNCSKFVDDSEDDSMSRLSYCSKLVDDSEDDSMSRLPKCSKLESVPVVTIPEEQIKLDEEFARQLDNELNQVDVDVEVVVENSDNLQVQSSDGESAEKHTQETLTDHVSVVKELSKRVDDTGQFFIVVRRGSLFTRCLNLWCRESMRTKPDKVLRVHFTGEDGIDSGAMAKEFLAKAIADMGNIMFPCGSPVDSTYNVQKGYFQSCGEIAAVSLAQGGPSPCVLQGCVYESMVNPETDFKSLNVEHITAEEKKMLENIQHDLDNHRDTIVDHGYTGVIDKEHINDITGSILISLVTRRQLYLSEFMRGLELYGLADIIRQKPEICKALFVMGHEKDVDANYVFSLMKPCYSVEGSTRKEVEESVMDSFQDFLISLEDEQKISGYTEALTWNYEDGEDRGSERQQSDKQPGEEFQTADVSVAGVLGWLTGQRHRPIDGDPLTIIVNFDHGCLDRNPKHTICFPRVAACGRELTLPVCHMGDTEQFRHTFLLAYCKGQSFSRP